LSNTTSPRILPRDRSTHSSTLGRSGSINLDRSAPAIGPRHGEPHTPPQCDENSPPARRRHVPSHQDRNSSNPSPTSRARSPWTEKRRAEIGSGSRVWFGPLSWLDWDSDLRRIQPP
jgi:hypothetical protein